MNQTIKSIYSEIKKNSKIIPQIELLSDEEIQTTCNNFLKKKPYPYEPIWIFGYGSLMWKSATTFIKKGTGIIDNYHREYCLWNITGRGTSEHPGLMMALRKGGSCRGMLFCLPSKTEKEELAKLFQREGKRGNYIPKWSILVLDGDKENKKIQAVSFVVNENSKLAIKQNLSRLNMDSKDLTKKYTNQ